MSNWRAPYPPPYPGEPWPPPTFMPIPPLPSLASHMSYDGAGVMNGPSPQIVLLRPTPDSRGYSLSPRRVLSPPPMSPTKRTVTSPVRRLVSPPPPIITGVPPRRITSPLRPRFLKEDDPKSESPVVFNAGVTFRLGSGGEKSPSRIHNHLQVQPASSVPQTQSSQLTRQIDNFLKKSDHTLDRWGQVMESRSGSRRRGRGNGSGHHRDKSAFRRVPPLATAEDSSLSLSLSSRARKSTSNAAIAVKAERHMKTMGKLKENSGVEGGSVPQKPVGVTRNKILIKDNDESCSSSDIDSLDDFDDSDDSDDDNPRGKNEAFEFSDDTSAEISKVH